MFSLSDPADPRDSLLVPRLAADALLDGLLWNSPLGVSYTGSTTHVLKHLEAGGAPPIDVLWTAAGALLGAPELVARFRKSLKVKSQHPVGGCSLERSRASQGRASVLYDLLYDGYQATLERWRTSLRAYGLNGVAPPRSAWLSCDSRGAR